MRRSDLQKLLRAAGRSLIFSGVALMLAGLARRAIRHSRVFAPRREPEQSWDPAAYGIAPQQVKEQWIETEDGELLYAWYCQATKPVASVLFCHGNSGNLTTSANIIPHLLDAGLNVLIFDYRGYGKSSGSPSFDGVVSDGVSAAFHHDTIRPAGAPSVLYGFSLGGAVAAQILRHHSFDGLILQSTFTNLRDLARANFPNIPLHLIAGDSFDTLEIVRNIRVPLLVLHGSADPTCPPSMGQALFEACPSPKSMHSVEGGLHKDLFVREHDRLVETLKRFASGLSSESSPTVGQPPRMQRLIDSLFRYARRQMRTRAGHQVL